MIEIKNFGDYLELDDRGHLIKVVAPALIQPEWLPLVNDVVEFYRAQAEGLLSSVYIRGSVAKGSAVAGISDVDSFFVTQRPLELSSEVKAQFRSSIGEKYPFCNGVELIGTSIDQMGRFKPPKKRSVWEELIKTQSACVWGHDFSEDISPFELKDMVAHSYEIKSEIASLGGKFEEARSTGENPNQVCVWIMKRLIRAGFEIVMMRERKWTRDLYPCFASFSKYYPDKSELMKKALHLALNPSSNPEDTLSLVGLFEPWLFKEIAKYVP